MHLLYVFYIFLSICYDKAVKRKSPSDKGRMRNKEDTTMLKKIMMMLSEYYKSFSHDFH